MFFFSPGVVKTRMDSSAFLCHTSMKGSREQSHSDRQLNATATRPLAACSAASSIGRNANCYSAHTAGVPFWVQDKQYNSHKESTSCAAKVSQGTYSL